MLLFREPKSNHCIGSEIPCLIFVYKIVFLCGSETSTPSRGNDRIMDQALAFS
jgi:hypothetical protein